jgi:nicotinamide-nucleotide amidase
MFTEELIGRARALLALCRDRRLKIAAAESCTGGLVAALLTEIPGSSAVVERGFVVYANEAKQEMLGVSPELIAEHGAVSAETARAMALGALAHSHADIAVAITGVAGPDGGTPQKPVGLVHFACARKGGVIEAIEKRSGDIGRSGIRLAALSTALDLLEQAAARG